MHNKISTPGVLPILILTLFSCTETNHHKLPARIPDHQKIKEIKLATKLDTVNYALGVVWADGVKSLGFKNISYTFYLGAYDNLRGDTSYMGVFKANEYINRVYKSVKSTSPDNLNKDFKKISDIKLVTKFDTFSYALGFAWCNEAKFYGISKSSPALICGLSNKLKGDTSIFAYASADRYLRKFVEDEREIKFADVKKTNAEWLENNRHNAGISEFPDGLQYKVLHKGTGMKPDSNDIFEAHYVAKLIDGTVFEDTDNTNVNAKFYLSGVNPALQEAILHMREGEKWELYVPYYLAYGSGGVRNVVPPYATIIYELELEKVYPQK